MHGYGARVAGPESHPQEPQMTPQGLLKELISELLQVQVMELGPILLPVLPEQEPVMQVPAELPKPAELSAGLLAEAVKACRKGN